MSEKSGLFTLSSNDFLKSAISAVFVAVVVALAGIVGPDFDVFTADWITIGKTVINAAISVFIARLSEKFLTDANGTLNLGVAKIPSAK